MAKMDTKPLPKLNKNSVYEDFEPTVDWLHGAGHDTLLVYLPGFKKEQLKVQVTSTRNLRITGENPLIGDNKFSRFRKELTIPSHYDTNQITAKFENGILHIKHPKKPTSTSSEKPQETAKTSGESANLQKPTNISQPQLKNQQENATHQGVVDPKTEVDDQRSGQKSPVEKDNEPENVKGKKTMDRGTVLRKNLDDQKGIDGCLNQASKVTNTSDEKQESFRDGNSNVAKMEKRETEVGRKEFKIPLYNQIIGGLIIGMKKTRKSKTLVMAGFLVLVIGMYVKCVVKSHGESKK